VQQLYSFENRRFYRLEQLAQAYLLGVRPLVVVVVLSRVVIDERVAFGGVGAQAYMAHRPIDYVMID
jgi:hypothetical protein